MRIELTPALRKVLQEAAGDESLPQGVRAAAAEGAAAATAEWDAVKAAVDAARQRKGPQAVPPLEELCRGGGIAFPELPKQAGKPPELQRRLDELKARLEQQQYDRMVADVTQGERKAAALREGGLSTYRQQISFGVHVLAMMGAFYAFGHVAGMAITPNRTAHPFIGLLFMMFALVLETVLYVIRSTVPPKLHQEVARRAVVARVAAQQERQRMEQDGGAAAGGGGGGSSGSTGRLGGGEGAAKGGRQRQKGAGTAEAAGKPAGGKKAD